MQDFSNHVVRLNPAPAISHSSASIFESNAHISNPNQQSNDLSLCLFFKIICYTRMYVTLWKKRPVATSISSQLHRILMQLLAFSIQQPFMVITSIKLISNQDMNLLILHRFIQKIPMKFYNTIFNFQIRSVALPKEKYWENSWFKNANNVLGYFMYMSFDVNNI